MFVKRMALLYCVMILVEMSWQDAVNVENFIHFPIGSPYIGMFVAIAVPIESRGPADVFLSMNFEGSYSLPQNQTTLTYPPLIATTATREFVYDVLRSKIDLYGYPGKPCLQRAICEAAQYTTKNYGVLGDLVHILLTPSSSKKEANLTDYEVSERYGKTNKHCKRYKKKCGLSILNLVSKVSNIFQEYDDVLFNLFPYPIDV